MRTFSKLMGLLVSAGVLLGLMTGCGGSPGTLTLIMPKIGSADAALLMTDDATVIIDAGESDDGDELLSLLRQSGRDTVDLMIISHYDKDHIGGAAKILGNMTVKRVIGSTAPKASDEMREYLAALTEAGVTEEILTKQETFTFGALSVTVDPPLGSYNVEDSNNASNIAIVSFGKIRMAFAGDAMTERLGEFPWPGKTYDLIKIPHHGRDAEDLGAYLGSLKDGAAAIVTSSKKTPESEELTAALSEAGISVYLTRKGDVTVTTDGTELTVSQR